MNLKKYSIRGFISTTGLRMLISYDIGINISTAQMKKFRKTKQFAQEHRS